MVELDRRLEPTVAPRDRQEIDDVDEQPALGREEPAEAGDAGEPGRGRTAEPEAEGDAGELSGCSHTRHLFT